MKQNCEVVKEYRLIEGEKGVREKCESDVVNSFFFIPLSFKNPLKIPGPYFSSTPQKMEALLQTVDRNEARVKLPS